ncbi:MAG: hypothetical protein RL060_1642 [Bacteroidota bacterium]|jgi:hypothetical protein
MQMATVSTIKIIKHTDIDFQKWDYAMAKACNSLVYGYSWYLNIVSPEWMGIVLNDYEAVMPITVHKKWGISYVSQPFCTQQLGLFASNEATIQSYLPEVITLLKAKFRYISIQLNYLNKLQNTNTLKNNFELSLAKPYAALYQHYSHGLKDNLRKAKKQAYAVEPTTHYQVIIDFFIQEKGAAYTHIKAEHYAILSEICRQAQAKNLLTCTLIRDQHQQIVATALFIEHAQRIIFLNGTSNHEGKKHGAFSFIIDHHIAANAEKPIVFDFEGAVDPNLAKFYQGFGSYNQPYTSFHYNNLPWPISLLKK